MLLITRKKSLWKSGELPHKMFQQFSELPGSSKFDSVSTSKVLSHILIFFLHVRSCVLFQSNERAETRKKPQLSHHGLRSSALVFFQPHLTRQNKGVLSRIGERGWKGMGERLFFYQFNHMPMLFGGILFIWKYLFNEKYSYSTECASVQSEWPWSFHCLYNTWYNSKLYALQWGWKHNVMTIKHSCTFKTLLIN